MGACASVLQPTVIFGATLLALGLAFRRFSGHAAKDSIPTVGGDSGMFATQTASVRSLRLFRFWLAEGYKKYGPGVFRVRAFYEWMLIISGPKLVDELSRAPDDVLSLHQATANMLQEDYTMGDWRDESPLLVALVKSRLTRSISHLFPCAMDEINAAFTDEITSKLDDNEWTPSTLSEALMRVVCRTSNRLFVGLPLCRNPEYVDLNVKYTVDVVISANIIKLFPAFMKPLVGRFMTPLPRTYARAERIMVPFLEERQRARVVRRGAWEEKPDDFLQWILDADEDHKRQPRALMTRLLRLNFGAVHTTALSFTFALYHVAAEPEKYQEPIRKEVHEALSRHGWTQAAMDQMHRTDSLLRESLRYHGIAAISMTRLALRDFTFSNGTRIKKGETVTVAARPTHHDSALYPEADAFDGFRFYNGREDERGLPNKLTSTGLDFLPFGTGRHACPGRFWAASEMKAMMAYMVTHYDMKMDPPGVVPDETWIALAVMPDRNARMLLRRRDVPVY